MKIPLWLISISYPGNNEILSLSLYLLLFSLKSKFISSFSLVESHSSIFLPILNLQYFRYPLSLSFVAIRLLPGYWWLYVRSLNVSFVLHFLRLVLVLGMLLLVRTFDHYSVVYRQRNVQQVISLIITPKYIRASLHIIVYMYLLKKISNDFFYIYAIILNCQTYVVRIRLSIKIAVGL